MIRWGKANVAHEQGFNWNLFLSREEISKENMIPSPSGHASVLGIIWEADESLSQRNIKEGNLEAN